MSQCLLEKMCTVHDLTLLSSHFPLHLKLRPHGTVIIAYIRYPYMPIGKVWIYRLLFVCFFCNFLCFCTVTDFSAEEKASNVKFYTAVHRRLRQCIFELCSPAAQNWTNWRHAHPHVNISVEMRRRKRHARDAPFVEYREACGRRIDRCG